MVHPRDEREWRREVERRLATNRSAISSVTGRIVPAVEDAIVNAVGKQPTAPIELVPSTSIYVSSSTGEWKGRFILDFPDVTVATDGSPLEVAYYELQGRQSGVSFFAETESGPASLTPPRAQAQMKAPRLKIGGGGRVDATTAKATARAEYPDLRADDGSIPFITMATSQTSSLRVDDLEPGSLWIFRARAFGRNSPTPGEWSAEIAVTILRDTLAPQQLTKPVATVTRGTITVTWDGLTVAGQLPADFRYAELAHGTGPNPTEIIARYNTAGGFTVISDIPYYDPQFFRIRAVDMSGNRGPWSEQEVAYVQPLVDEDIILSTIDAAQTLLINVDAGVSILSDTILTRHLVITEDMTVALLNAHKIVAGDIEANAVTTDKLAAGAVTAAKLTSTIVLTSTVIAGDPLGTHAQMDSSGFRVFANDPTDGIPNEVVRMGVEATDDYFSVSRADGTLSATISQDGVGSFKEVNANQALYYKGLEMQRLLDNKGKGIITSGYRYTNSANNAWIGGPFMEYLRCGAVLEPNRLYRIWTSPIRVDTTADVGVTVVIRYNYDIPCTRDNGSDLIRSYTSRTTNPSRHMAYLSELFAFGGTNSRFVSFLMIFGIQEGTGLECGIRADGGSPVRMVIEDIGPTVDTTGTGEWLDSPPQAGPPPPPPPPPTQTYYKEWGCYNSANYDGAGNRYTWNDNQMFQGLSPAGWGNLKSIGLFGDMTGDLAGATINFVNVYFNFNHWYYNSGGTARIGVHGHTGIPSTDWGRGPLSVVSGGWPKPGARWVQLSSSHWDGFRTGAYRGVYLEGDGTYGTYGYADRPVIGINYTK